jgi:hypothetical protein
MRWTNALFPMPLLGLAAMPLHATDTAKVNTDAAVRIEDFTIPTPGEFFSAVDAIGRPAWGQLVRAETPPSSDSREMIALSLGTLVADGYVAVEAQDGQAVKNIGKQILDLAKKLNVSQSVLGRAGSIADFADANDWNALREEIEATQNEVKLDMAEQKDDRLVTLVTAAAWVRGTELASAIVARTYSPEAAGLLCQPGVASFLVERLNALPENTRTLEQVTALRNALASAQKLVTDGPPSQEQALEISMLMREALAPVSPAPKSSP